MKVLIADDQAVVRLGFTAMLAAQPDLEVVGAVGDGRAAVVLARQREPDVALLDVRMPVMGGIDATRDLKLPTGRRSSC